ncbi:MAG: 50S ribosomal protein L13 [Anaerolineae bacterium]|nr:50S ribosomal protein L13 [Anaerolineae bacterium]
MKYKTYTPSAPTIERKWYVVDAAGMTLGRLASRVAHILRGKHKATFTPNLDTGDFVIVLNSEKVTVTGDRMESKLYRRHSQYPGGFKEFTLREMMAKDSRRVIEIAVKGMLPHNRLGDKLAKKLKVYKGAEHPHAAQKPEVIDISNVNVTTWRPKSVEKQQDASVVHEVGTYVPPKEEAASSWVKVAESVKDKPALRLPKAEPKAKPAKKAAKAPAGADDLQRIEGIGPKVKQALYDAGINTFAQLAALSGEELTRIVKTEGRVNIVGDAATWPKQAKLIVDGDEEGLKVYQDRLVGGREPNE